MHCQVLLVIQNSIFYPESGNEAFLNRFMTFQMEALTISDLKRLCAERGLTPGKLRKQQIIELLVNSGRKYTTKLLCLRLFTLYISETEVNLAA